MSTFNMTFNGEQDRYKLLVKFAGLTDLISADILRNGETAPTISETFSPNTKVSYIVKWAEGKVKELKQNN